MSAKAILLQAARGLAFWKMVAIRDGRDRHARGAAYSNVQILRFHLPLAPKSFRLVVGRAIRERIREAKQEIP